MYSGLLLLAILVLPIPVIIAGIKQKKPPYKACVDGIIAAGIGSALIFVLSEMNGSGIGDEMRMSIYQMADAAGSQWASAFKDLPELMDTVEMTLPAVIIIWISVVSYLEYLIFSHIIKVEGKKAELMPPLREFSWARSSVLGWFAMFIAAWLMRAMGVGVGEAIELNVGVLFQMAFTLQGMSFILFFFHMKKFPKAIAIILVIVLLLIPTGTTILFIVGVADIILTLRRRV